MRARWLWGVGLEALAVVFYDHDGLGAAPLENDVHRGGVGMLVDVIQRFLRDPIDVRLAIGRILLNADYRDVRDMIPHREVICTGPIDEYFEFRFGTLPYRSLEFKFETHNVPVWQEGPVINYPNENAYTRVTEFKYLTGQSHAKTTLVYEYPRAAGDPYYPIPRPENNALYRKYQTLAAQTPGVHFLGRLGTYKYYNMDQCVAQALSYYRKALLGQEALASTA